MDARTGNDGAGGGDDARGRRELERLRAIQWLFDNAIRIPGTRWRFGLDALFGLVPGHEYRTTIELRKYREARKTGAGLVFAETADAPTAHVRRSVSLSHLDRGQYMLSVTVRDSVTGREATREQLINITR